MMPAHETRPRPLWSHVAAFIGLTFALTWLVDLSMYLRGGLQMPGALAGIQLQMLLPAFLPDLKNAYASVLLIAYLHALNDQLSDTSSFWDSSRTIRSIPSASVSMA